MSPDWISDFLLITTGVSGGILAGFYAAFTLVVFPALSSTPTTSATAFMNAVNRHAERPAFLSLFFLSLLSSLGYTGYTLVNAMLLQAAGSVLVFSGALLTIFINVPLNRALQKNTVSWKPYRRSWNRANILRLITSAAGALLLFLSA